MMFPLSYGAKDDVPPRKTNFVFCGAPSVSVTRVPAISKISFSEAAVDVPDDTSWAIVSVHLSGMGLMVLKVRFLSLSLITKRLVSIGEM